MGYNQFNTEDVKNKCESKLGIEFRGSKELNGWFINQGKKVARITVPKGKKSLKPKTFSSMANMLKLTEDQLIDLLKCPLTLELYLKILFPKPEETEFFDIAFTGDKAQLNCTLLQYEFRTMPIERINWEITSEIFAQDLSYRLRINKTGPDGLAHLCAELLKVMRQLNIEMVSLYANGQSLCVVMFYYRESDHFISLQNISKGINLEVLNCTLAMIEAGTKEGEIRDWLNSL